MGFQLWLENMSPDAIAGILRRRPDVLVGYRPTDTREVVARLCSPSGIQLALGEVNAVTLELAARLPVDNPDPQAAASLVNRGLAWWSRHGTITAADPHVTFYASMAHRPITLPDIEDSSEVNVDTVSEFSGRAAADLLDICRLLVEGAATRPIMVARSGGVGPRERARLEIEVGCSPYALELCLNVVVAAGLLEINDGRNIVPSFLALHWLDLNDAAKFQAVLMTWWNHPGALVYRTSSRHTHDSYLSPEHPVAAKPTAALAPVAPQARNASQRDLRHGLAAVIAESGLGRRSFDGTLIAARLAWHRPLAWGQLSAMHPDVLEQHLSQLDAFGIEVDHSISPLGLALVHGNLAAVETICHTLLTGQRSTPQGAYAQSTPAVVTTEFLVEPQALGVLVAPGRHGATPLEPVGSYATGATSYATSMPRSDPQSTSSTLRHVLGQFPATSSDDSGCRRLVACLAQATELDSLERRVLAEAICEGAMVEVTLLPHENRSATRILGRPTVERDLIFRAVSRTVSGRREPLSRIETVTPVWPDID